MAKIIISYRRSDTDAISGRIRDRLAGHFGDASIFMDIDNIPFGTDFRDHIQQAFEHCDVVIIIVGVKWIGPGKGKRSRINEQTDPVRIEVETALKRGVPILPVLVNGARMPTSEELPDTIADFAFRNAAEVDTGRDFHNHMDRVIRAVESILQARSPAAGLAKSHAAGSTGPAPPAARRKWLAIAGVAATLAIGVAVGSVLYFGRPTTPVVTTTRAPPPSPISAPAPTASSTATTASPPLIAPPQPKQATAPAACSSATTAWGLDETKIPQAGPALRDTVKDGVMSFFRCALASGEQFARVFATLSVVIAEYAPNDGCFGDLREGASRDWSPHKAWADQQGRADLMLVSLRRKIDLAHASCIDAANQPLFYVDMARALATATASGDNVTLTNPTLKGRRIDRCLHFARDCNEPAAVALCQRYGFAKVAKWEWAYVSPTVALGDRAACAANCGAFTTVNCTR